MSEKDLSDFLNDMGDKPVFRELDEAGYSYVKDDHRGYWVMAHDKDKPIIYYDPKTDTALPVLIVEQQETYMNN